MGWPKKELDNKFNESHEQLEMLDIEVVKPRVPFKYRIQHNTIKS